MNRYIDELFTLILTSETNCTIFRMVTRMSASTVHGMRLLLWVYILKKRKIYSFMFVCSFCFYSVIKHFHFFLTSSMFYFVLPEALMSYIFSKWSFTFVDYFEQ